MTVKLNPDFAKYATRKPKTGKGFNVAGAIVKYSIYFIPVIVYYRYYKREYLDATNFDSKRDGLTGWFRRTLYGDQITDSKEKIKSYLKTYPPEIKTE